MANLVGRTGPPGPIAAQARRKSCRFPRHRTVLLGGDLGGSGLRHRLRPGARAASKRQFRQLPALLDVPDRELAFVFGEHGQSISGGSKDQAVRPSCGQLGFAFFDFAEHQELDGQVSKLGPLLGLGIEARSLSDQLEALTAPVGRRRRGRRARSIDLKFSLLAARSLPLSSFKRSSASTLSARARTATLRCRDDLQVRERGDRQDDGRGGGRNGGDAGMTAGHSPDAARSDRFAAP